jgi:hypothetical protein
MLWMRVRKLITALAYGGVQRYTWRGLPRRGWRNCNNTLENGKNDSNAHFPNKTNCVLGQKHETRST